MAEPARESAAAQDPPHSRRKSDPMSPGWADVRQILADQGRLCALGVAELERRPDDAVAQEIARLNARVMDRAVEIARRRVIDEAVLEAERARAYAQGAADCKAARCRLEVVDGGRVTPGPH